MECRIEACDLRDVRRDPPDCPYRSEVVRLVQRRQRHKLLQLIEDRGVDDHRRRELLTAMHDSMADGQDAQAIRMPGDPFEERGQRTLVVAAAGARTPDGLIGHRPALGVNRDKSRFGSDALDLAVIAQHERVTTLVQGEHRELDARRSCVDDEDDVRHAMALRRRAAMRATAQDAMRARTVSARLVRMMGARAPRTIPAPWALARYPSCLTRMFPASRSGTTRMSARPATGEAIDLIFAASSDTALSNARGPSTTPPVICPRSAILHSAAASSAASVSRSPRPTGWRLSGSRSRGRAPSRSRSERCRACRRDRARC